jgi:phenylalanyl-tRNA synthetase beta chain
MNIQILDSWLREHLKTKATAKQIAEIFSLTSASVEKTEKYNNDYLYHLEITSNRPDLMSVLGIAREASAALWHFGIEAIFMPLSVEKNPSPPAGGVKDKLPLTVENDKSIVNRICAVVLNVKLKDSPKFISERLEAMGIRSLNNIIDITNYVMREIGHPTHVFDYDRIPTHKIIIRKSKSGEKVVTLDGKEHILKGEDIVADNGNGEIIDLLGIMGTANSVITDKTKRIIFFIDNNKTSNLRKTSMGLGIRTEAAIVNEKGVDPQLAMDALLRGIKLYEEFAEGSIASEIIDIYPNKATLPVIKINEKKINKIIGVDIPLKNSVKILEKLGFNVSQSGIELTVKPPSNRANDITLAEDLIEEIARINGYDKLPSLLPPLLSIEEKPLEKDSFYWTLRFKNALKYWGFTETYTYSFVSEDLLDGPVEDALEITNPLTEAMVYMRKTLVPSLLEVIKQNSTRKEIKIFEIANVYERVKNELPKETLRLAAVVKKQNLSFFEIKGIIEQLLIDSGIKNFKFKESEVEASGASVFIDKDYVGEIQMLDDNLINFELNFNTILEHVSLKKAYKPLGKYPPVVEDLAIVAGENVRTNDLISDIKKQSDLIEAVSLLDQYHETRTFHIVYRHFEKNLTDKEISEIREKILASLKDNFAAHLKK